MILATAEDEVVVAALVVVVVGDADVWCGQSLYISGRAGGGGARGVVWTKKLGMTVWTRLAAGCK